jgi:dTDP-4-dehydrorhamnose 3,5-epimerase
VKVLPTDLEGVLVIEPDVHRDDRGFFLETYNQPRYRDLGLEADFVQDNHSRSVRGTLRGLHTQVRHTQGKLLRVVEGEIFDVAVDVREGSPSFGRWVAAVLSAESFRQLWIAPGFAHGFYVTSERAQVEYKCTEVYDASDEVSILWNDPDIGIDWPATDPVLSEKDRRASRLCDLRGRLPVYSPPRQP